MNRRTLLAALAAAGGAAGTAGCLQGFRADPGTEPTSSTTEPPDDDDTAEPTTTREGDAREPNALDSEWNPSGGPVESFAVGDRDTVAFPDANRPHGVTFWNRVDRERDVRVTVVDGASDTGRTLGPVAVPAGHTVELSLQEPTRYALSLAVGDEPFGTVTVGREWFDCNHSGTSYGLGETDIVDYGTTSTLVDCARPVIAATTLDVTDRGCATDDDSTATIAYDGERITVDGTFIASNPCHELSIASTTYNDETNTATIVVDATHPDEPCQDCVGTIDYQATIDLEHDLPDTVELRHRDTDGDTERVATASRTDH